MGKSQDLDDLEEVERLDLPIDDLIDSIPVLAEDGPDHAATAELLQTFVTDVARHLDDHDTIARRYGFPGRDAMEAWIDARPAVGRRIKETRAAWESQENAETRVKAMVSLGVEAALPDTTRLMFASDKPNIQIEALKIHARIAGLDITPRGERDQGDAQERFTITINVGGNETRISTLEKSAKVIEG